MYRNRILIAECVDVTAMPRQQQKNHYSNIILGKTSPGVPGQIRSSVFKRAPARNILARPVRSQPSA